MQNHIAHNEPPFDLILFFLVFYLFLTTPALPRVPVFWFPVRQTYSLSSPAFKRVTCRRAIKSHFPSPLIPQVHEGATGRLEHSNNLGKLENFKILLLSIFAKEIFEKFENKFLKSCFKKPKPRQSML